MKFAPVRLPLFAALFVVSACAPTTLPPEEGEHRAAVAHLKQAAAKSLTAEQRVALYLESAQEASDLLGSRSSGEAARVIYNKAAADLTVLLRSAKNGSLWNRPLTLTSGSGNYRLRFARGSRDGIWDPDYFTSFTPAAAVKSGSFKQRNRQDGIGAAMVGIRQTQPPEPFANRAGVTAAVTAVLDFKGRDAILTLIDPTKTTKARIAGNNRPLEADFTAPLAYLPQDSEWKAGLAGALFVDKMMNTTGLYQLQPYEPERIPLILIHGLISTPRMWRNVINELESDPVIRKRYQPWVFAYPTGNPPFYSALRLREALEKFRGLHPESPDCVLVAHSMGGLLTRIQVTTLDRGAWDVMGKNEAAKVFANVHPNDLLERATIFRANPHISRVIFICTPHRGSEMAIGSIGQLGRRLIRLPGGIANSLQKSVGNSIAVVTGDPDRLPNSIDGLSPRNPALKVLDSRPIEVPHHSIIGDRGKGDTPNSSDGVVEYWSSHLDSAQSEKIVPGPHGSCELPETIAEIQRILHLHLKSN